MNKNAFLILAAGGSKRMDKTKSLLEWKGKRLIDWQIEKAKLICPENVFVVLGAQASKITNLKGVELIINEDWEEGIGSSIKKGITHISTNEKNIQSVMISLVDQPLIPVSHYEKILKIFLSGNKEIVATSLNGKAVVPAIFSSSYFTQLMKLKGDIGARKLIRENIAHCTLVESTFPYIDVDTSKEYEEFIKSHK